MSFDRPLSSQFRNWELPFVTWAEANGYALDYAVNSDLEFHPELLKHYDDIVNQIPLRRVGSVGDVAGVILFLASPMGDYLNGVTIDINGGSWFQ